jgi:hypothetical protein
MRPGIAAGVIGGVLPGICGTILGSFISNNRSIDSLTMLYITGLCHCCSGLFHILVGGGVGGLAGAYIGVRISETDRPSIVCGLLGGAILAFILALLNPTI